MSNVQNPANSTPSDVVGPPPTGSLVSSRLDLWPESIDISADRRTGFGRLVRIELRKMTGTLSGRTLMGLAVGLGLVIELLMLLLKSASQKYDFTFTGFIGGGLYGATLVLPSVVILAVTGEWTQRAAMGTFTLVPNRGRVMAAKLGAVYMVVLATFTATVAGAAVVNVISGATATGPTVWDPDVRWLVGPQLLPLVYVATMAFGFALLALNSSAALVGYYLASFALPQFINTIGLFGRIDQFTAWINPSAYSELAAAPSESAWAHFAVSAAIWVVIPISVGIRRVMTAEIK